jgi:type VI secretion system protein ImpA
MPLLDIPALLKPVSDAAPCGADPVHDDAYVALVAAASRMPEQEIGKVVKPAIEPNWEDVAHRALALFVRCKDLRVAMHLLRAAMGLEGLAGVCDGLVLVQGLLERYWEQVHPQLDASDKNDPTMRLNALYELGEPTQLPFEVQRVTLDGTKLAPTGRHVEIVVGGARAGAGENPPSADGLARALRDVEARTPGVLARLRSGVAAIDGIDKVLCAHAADAVARPNLQALRTFTGLVAQATARAGGASTGVPLAGAVDASPHPAGATGTIGTRDDAMRELQRIADWIEKHEPGHPAPLLILRARRLMAKSFLEIVKDILPEQLKQVQQLAGVTDAK